MYNLYQVPGRLVGENKTSSKLRKQVGAFVYVRSYRVQK